MCQVRGSIDWNDRDDVWSEAEDGVDSSCPSPAIVIQAQCKCRGVQRVGGRHVGGE